MKILFGLALCVPLLGGCIPYLETYIDRYGVTGTLVDASSGDRLEKESVTVVVDDAEFTRTTNSNGFFITPPREELYWTWPICGLDILNDEFTTVTILLAGYVPRQIFVCNSRMGNSDFSESLYKPIQDNYILLGEIRLTKETDLSD